MKFRWAHFLFAALVATAGTVVSLPSQARADEEAASAEAATPPPLPGYFSGANRSREAALARSDRRGRGRLGHARRRRQGRRPRLARPPRDLYDRIAHNLFSINMVWTLVTGFLVMFMQAGFMFVETGLCRAKNAAHTAAMNFMIYPLGCLAFWAYGFAIGWGNWWNGPVPPGWYASLGPGTVGAEQRLGARRGDRRRRQSRPASSQYGLIGHEGLLPRAARRRRQRDGASSSS